MNINTVEKAAFGPWWRSENMDHLEVTMQREVAYHTVEKLGEIACCQFVDV